MPTTDMGTPGSGSNASLPAVVVMPGVTFACDSWYGMCKYTFPPQGTHDAPRFMNRCDSKSDPAEWMGYPSRSRAVSFTANYAR